MATQFRPSSAIGSRKLQALSAIKAHFRECGKTPSYSDIGRALDISRKRAFELVRSLAADGDVILKPGPRGIVLPEPAEMMAFDDLMLQLQAHGFIIFERPPGSPDDDSAWPLTHSPLPLMPELDEIPAIERATDDAADLQH